ncbi:MAG: energy transducer TonB, partial [Candidatus Sulfotelmatobacter sp.]
MKRSVTSATAAVVLCFAMGFAPALLAQKASKSDRKVVSMVKPAYPQTLKNLHIEGLVRLTVTVLPNGAVTDVEVRG